ncbi:transcriptional regulator, partial [Deltaproteobacteria bacterium OttesenSCG-928-M10]|nr:transcriptional regulator [Deltaproteobacteria bacterium OttesenSCG-928-M10]
LNHSLKKNVAGMSREMEALFQRYQWPGNVRELEHALEGAMNLVRGDERILRPDHFSASLMSEDWEDFRHQETMVPEAGGRAFWTRPGSAARAAHEPDERDMLARALTEHDGIAARAARSLGLSPQLMHYKMKKYGLKKKVIIGDY